MKAVLEILTGLGIAPSNPPHRDARLTIRNAPWMPLHIESIGSGPTGRQAWSVAHYGKLNGDIMRDPEICFEMRDGAMVPFSFRNDYAGIDIDVRDSAARSLTAGIADFARMWSENVYDQGFVKVALPVRSEHSRKRRNLMRWRLARLRRLDDALDSGTATWRQQERRKQLSAEVYRLPRCFRNYIIKSEENTHHDLPMPPHR